ncbi:hypothetical protein OIU78_012612 [Salix suchowensis]|nr:hypothetical protein OIU78_012612 [Salix suchowensis]
MWSHPYGKTDLEAGARPLYPMMLESPATPVGLHSQGVFNLVLSITFNNRGGSSGCFYPSDFRLLFDYWGGVGALYTLLPMYYYHQKHPVNYILLGIFTISLAFAVGLTCAFTEGKVILESAILTSVVVVSLTMYTFWAARRGHDFNFLGPFPVWCSHGSYSIFFDPDSLSTGQNLCDDLWLGFASQRRQAQEMAVGLVDELLAEIYILWEHAGSTTRETFQRKE